MQPELNRRTFLVLIGAATAAAAVPARAAKRTAVPPNLMPTNPHPRCFFDMSNAQPPARPKSSAITYIQTL